LSCFYHLYATAWYHKKLPPDLQQDLHKALAESEAWALGGYAEILAKATS